MLHYSLAKIADRPKGSKVPLPPIAPRLAPEKQYLVALRTILTAAAREVREGIIPLYQQERQVRSYTGDAREEWFARLRSLINEMEATVTGTVSGILDLEAKQHTKGFMAAAKRALGIDLAAVIHDEDLVEYVQMAVARNTSLIKNFGDDLLKRIEQTVYDNSIAGNTVATLRAKLKEQFGISDRRAKLIAQDQTAKFNSDLNKVRQTQAGVTSYQWMTSHDERVRERHRRLDGKEYKWGEPTGAEDGLPPGQPIRCRCVARGVVTF
jgi:SPP1 gp7 family putative phage head morphogenesis protein